MEINALPCQEVHEQHGATNGIPQLWGATAKCPLTRSWNSLWRAKHLWEDPDKHWKGKKSSLSPHKILPPQQYQKDRLLFLSEALEHAEDAPA